MSGTIDDADPMGIFKSISLNSATGSNFIHSPTSSVNIEWNIAENNEIASLTIPNDYQSDYYSIDLIPSGFDKGIAFERYGSHTPWSRPKPLEKSNPVSNMNYWIAGDRFMVIIPLSGNGYEASILNGWTIASKSGCKGQTALQIPVFAVGTGLFSHAHAVIRETWRVGMRFMNVKLVEEKEFPEIYKMFGWCTWNASKNGALLSSSWLMEQMMMFQRKKIRFGWVLIDDGYVQNSNGKMLSFIPDPLKFPTGLKAAVLELKKYVEHVGIWHTINGHWNGLEKSDFSRYSLFTYDTNKYFVVPAEMPKFFKDWYEFLSSQSISFTKVDNQIIVDRLAAWIYSLNDFAETIHSAINSASQAFFQGNIVNCMDMAPHAYYHFNSTSLARVSEDYFPAGESYNIDEMGNAFIHILMCTFNSLYFSQIVFPDWDMFEVSNPFGEFHGLARTLSNGPIYITDSGDAVNQKLIDKLVFNDLTSIRADVALVPTLSSLFQVVDLPKGFRCWSTVTRSGTVYRLLLISNIYDMDDIDGKFNVESEFGLSGQFLVYDYFRDQILNIDSQTSIGGSLCKGEYRYYIIVKVGGFVPLGLMNKFNSVAGLKSFQFVDGSANVDLVQGGTFMAFSAKSIARVSASGDDVDYQYSDGRLDVELEIYQKHLFIEFY